jgi:putative ABC transport system permease protein
MIKSYVKVAFRNLLKSKVTSFINIGGLAVGMAVALLIGLWVYYQFSYDRFLPGYKNIYQVRYKTHSNGEIFTQNSVCFPLADALRKDVPGIQYVVQADWMGEHGLVVGDKKIYSKGAMAGSDFLKAFQYQLLKGNPEQVLREPYSIVLTASSAKALFGDEDPVNKTVRIDNLHDLSVTGVMKDIPANSSLQFNYIVPFSYYVQAEDWVRQSQTEWGNNSFQTFVVLQPGISYAQVEPGIKFLLKKYNPVDFSALKTEVFMQPMKEWHLFTEFKNGQATGGLIDYVKMFGIIGILVLVIACINFMNLSTARSEKRAREVGIRKAVGSQRRQLIFQFLTESVVITFIAFVLSLVIVQLALPSFNMLTKTAITVPYSNGIFWCIMLTYVLITGLFAGSRPAFYLSSFQPVNVLKGVVKAGRMATLPRKILVVLQFSCSVALIISAIIVYQQIQYARSRPTGYDANRLMTTDVSHELSQNYQALKNEMLQDGIVTAVTKSSSPVTAIYSINDINNWPGKFPGETLSMATIAVSDTDYFKTLGIQIKEGRNFTGNIGADSLCMIINEAAVKRMRFTDPLDKRIEWGQTKQPARIIGVVKDALMASPFAAAIPTYFMFKATWENTITYRLSPNVNIHAAIAKLTPIFNKYNPAYPYIYHFVDETYQSKFDLETLIGKLAGIFASLAIFISCLGLFGLASYMAEQRRKEIGIRKVLGASVTQVWALLSKDFIVLVSISCLIASPVALYFLRGWLTNYDYRISIRPDVFIISGIMAIVITLVTISFQAIKAAIANPVRSLRTE